MLPGPSRTVKGRRCSVPCRTKSFEITRRTPLVSPPVRSYVLVKIRADTRSAPTEAVPRSRTNAARNYLDLNPSHQTSPLVSTPIVNFARQSSGAASPPKAEFFSAKSPFRQACYTYRSAVFTQTFTDSSRPFRFSWRDSSPSVSNRAELPAASLTRTSPVAA